MSASNGRTHPQILTTWLLLIKNLCVSWSDRCGHDDACVYLKRTLCPPKRTKVWIMVCFSGMCVSCVCVRGKGWATSYCKRACSKQSPSVAKDRIPLSIYAANICSVWSSAIDLIPVSFVAKANVGVGMVAVCSLDLVHKPGRHRPGQPQAAGVQVTDKSRVRSSSASLPTSQLFFLFLCPKCMISPLGATEGIRGNHFTPTTIRANQEESLFPGCRLRSHEPKWWKLPLLSGSHRRGFVVQIRNTRMSFRARLKLGSLLAWKLENFSLAAQRNQVCATRSSPVCSNSND